MTPGFDDVIHPHNRLQLCAMLAAADSVEFQAARDALEVSDSVLSKQIKVLESAGYVRIIKGSRDAKPRTWLKITSSGRAAFEGHIAALRAITRQTDTTDEKTGRRAR